MNGKIRFYVEAVGHLVLSTLTAAIMSIPMAFGIMGAGLMLFMPWVFQHAGLSFAHFSTQWQAIPWSFVLLNHIAVFLRGAFLVSLFISMSARSIYHFYQKHPEIENQLHEDYSTRHTFKEKNHV